jgi:purine-nucleoside phosphorylase
MHPYSHKIDEAVTFIRQKTEINPIVGVVLGTGLGKFADKLDIKATIPYNTIPHFPVSTVEFHAGKLLFGHIGNVPVVAMQGRFHYYEGYSLQEVTFPIRVMHKLGIQRLLLSNAAGGMNLNYKKGDLVLLTDHINTLPDNPLRGLNDSAFGNRFPDMSQPYDPQLNKQLLTTARTLGLNLHEGVYVAVAGPNLETRAEYRYLRAAGADMVGMSTVPEVIVANQLGLPCAAISVITDECDPDNLMPANIADIISVANQADEGLSELFEKVIEGFGGLRG